MATNNKRTVTETSVDAEATEISAEKSAKVKHTAKEEKRPESTYTAAELANAHKTFNTSYEIVKTALRVAKKERATFAEAKEIIDTFRTKEVK